MNQVTCVHGSEENWNWGGDEDSGDAKQWYEDGGEIFSSPTESTTTKDLPSGESNTPSWSWGPTYKMKKLSFLTLGSSFKRFCDSRNVPKCSCVVPVPTESRGLACWMINPRLIQDFLYCESCVDSDSVGLD